MVVLIAATSTAWLRLPAVVRDVLWAEDGRNFLQDALTDGPLRALVIPYSGYLHTVPRLIAGFTVTFLPVPLYAVAEAFAACLVAGIIAVVVYVCSADVLAWLPARLAVAMLTVCAPLEPREVLGNTANLHTLMLWMVFWILLYTPKTRRGDILLAVCAFLGAATEIQTVFLLPILAVRWRVRGASVLRIALTLGIVLQLIVTIASPRHRSGVGENSPASIAFGYLINAVVPIWIQQAGIGPLVATGGFWLCVVLFLPFVGLLAFIVWRGTRLQRIAGVGAMLLSMVVYSGSVWETPELRYEYFELSQSSLSTLAPLRYGVLPSMLLLALIPLALVVFRDSVLDPGRRRALSVRLIGGALVLAFVASVAVHLAPQYSLRDNGPQWRPEALAAARACSGLPADHTISLGESLHWVVHVPCARLDPDG